MKEAAMAVGILEARRGARARAQRQAGQDKTPSPQLEVVAEIMADGTIRARGDRQIEVDECTAGWFTGHLAGGGWVLWWQRRTS
jgi:hypothetical protein